MLHNPASWSWKCSQRAEGEQEGPTSGLTCRPRRPPSRHRWPFEEENSGGRRTWEHVLNAVAVFRVVTVKRPLSSLPVTNVCSALRRFHIPPPSLLPQALLAYPIIPQGQESRTESREWTKSRSSKMEQRPESCFLQHTMMSNPFPEMPEVNGGQKVLEPRSELSKNTSPTGGGGVQAEAAAGKTVW